MGLDKVWFNCNAAGSVGSGLIRFGGVGLGMIRHGMDKPQ